ncbi:MAG: GCN5-related N-acetyltransferase [Marmoricola sp.]|nr:GCN5-related N-acetyltransferase [Marmoricola sp.]
MPTDRVQTSEVNQELTQEVILRPAAAEDLDELAELYIATRRDAAPAMPAAVHADAEIRAWFAGLPQGQPAREIWLAEDGGEVLGFAVLTDAWLDSLYVGPQHQATGIGSMLLDLVKAQRPDGFALWVFASNTAARTFYHRHGLVELEHTDGSANEERSPDVRMAWPGTDPVSYLRAQIDEVDDELALLLARRFALTAAVQGYKERGGQQGRDPEREREIADRMAAHAPGLGAEPIARIMHTVISESLDAYESGSSR